MNETFGSFYGDGRGRFLFSSWAGRDGPGETNLSIFLPSDSTPLPSVFTVDGVGAKLRTGA